LARQEIAIERVIVLAEEHALSPGHKTASKLPSANDSACPSSTDEEFGAVPRRSRAFAAMAGEISAAVTWPLG
jgi:hypothetical protein